MCAGMEAHGDVLLKKTASDNVMHSLDGHARCSPETSKVCC